MSESENAAIYDDMKRRIQALDYRVEDFADFIGVGRTSIPRWRSTGVPRYILRLLDSMEANTVLPSWRYDSSRLAPTSVDCLNAMRQAATAVVDDAIRKGWTRQQIGEALRTLAAETDRGSTA